MRMFDPNQSQCLWTAVDASPGSVRSVCLRVCVTHAYDLAEFYAYYYPRRLEGGVALRRRGG
jgi:hypothetical protein